MKSLIFPKRIMRLSKPINPNLYKKCKEELRNEKVSYVKKLEALDKKDNITFSKKREKIYITYAIKGVIRFLKLQEEEQKKVINNSSHNHTYAFCSDMENARRGRNELKKEHSILYAKIEKELKNEQVKTLEEAEKLNDKDLEEYKEKYGDLSSELDIRILIRFLKLPEKEQIKKLKKGLSKPSEY